MDPLNVELGTYRFVLDLANAFSSSDIHLDTQDEFAFTWEGRQWTFTILPIRYLQSPTLCHRFVAEDLVGWTKPATIQLYHYIDDVMLTSDSLSDLRQAAPMFVTPAAERMGHQDSRTPKSLVVTIRKAGQGGDRQG